MRAHLTKLVALALAATLGGCLDRKEKVTVHGDGSVHVALAFKGDAGEFAPEAAEKLPAGGPWRVHDEDVARADGNGSDHIRTAEADFRDAGEIPETAGAAEDPAPLHARTTLSVERLEGGKTRWTFERRYAPRAHAWREKLFERFFPEDLRKALEHKEGDPPLPQETLERAASALIGFEREKSLVFLESALDASGRATTARRLEARDEFGRWFDATWTTKSVLDQIDRTPEERSQFEKDYQSKVSENAARTAARALEEREVSGSLRAAFERARRVHDATEQLQAHNFEVRVEFPGKVVLSDGLTTEDDGRTALFKFGGKDLNDGEHVLRAVAQSD